MKMKAHQQRFFKASDRDDTLSAHRESNKCWITGKGGNLGTRTFPTVAAAKAWMDNPGLFT